MSKGAGARNDLLALRDAIKAGKSDIAILDDDTLSTVAMRHTRAVLWAKEVYRGTGGDRGKLQVTLCIGPSGTGKSHCAKTEGAYYYDGGFWNGYQGEEVVIMDDFGGHCCTPTEFQRICDGYPLRINTKGSFIWFNGRTIRITSNYIPDAWWKDGTRKCIGAIHRRINDVHYHDRYQHFIRFTSDEWMGPGTITAMDKFLLYYKEKFNVLSGNIKEVM